VHWYHYDKSVLNSSRAIHNGHTAAVIQLGTKEATVAVSYSCLPTAAGKSAKVNLTVDIGWTQQFTIGVTII
jgi:hypothetical protein